VQKQATIIISINLKIKEQQVIVIKQGFISLIGEGSGLKKPTSEQHESWTGKIERQQVDFCREYWTIE